MNSYYQTTPETLPDLLKADAGAKTQEQTIYKFMRDRGGRWDAWGLQKHFNYEITSIRRALFNLEKKDKKIVQVDWTKGIKGKKVGVYSVVWQGEQSKMFE